jgi:hypothetical protein
VEDTARNGKYGATKALNTNQRGQRTKTTAGQTDNAGCLTDFGGIIQLDYAGRFHRSFDQLRKKPERFTV